MCKLKKKVSKSVAHVMQQCSYPPVIWWLREYRKKIVETKQVCNLQEGSASVSRKEQGQKGVLYITSRSSCGTYNPSASHLSSEMRMCSRPERDENGERLGSRLSPNHMVEDAVKSLLSQSKKPRKSGAFFCYFDWWKVLNDRI